MNKTIHYFFVFFWCVIASSCSVTKVHLSSYAKPGTDVSDVLQKLVDKHDVIVMGSGTWIISKPIYLRSGISIIGAENGKTIVKLDEHAIANGGMKFTAFTTVMINNSISTTYSHNLPEKNYGRKMMNNIVIKNIVFDINRHRDFFSVEGRNIVSANVNAIRFENCESCKLVNCHFLDYCEPDFHNGAAVVFIVKSKNCEVSGCYSDKCTFLAIIGSDCVLVRNNKGYNSVGTWIETVGGGHHKIIGNYLCEVYRQVSSIGINSVNCEISANTIDNPVGDETSCLTLGHYIPNPASLGYYEMSARADYAFVHHNIFKTEGVRVIYVQCGYDICIENNSLTCKQLSSNNLTGGAIGVRGGDPDFRGMIIKGNQFFVEGGGKGYVIQGQGLNDVLIEENEVHADCESVIKIWHPTNKVILKKNTVNNEGAYILDLQSVPIVIVDSNDFWGGSMTVTCEDFTFINNKWDSISSNMTLKGMGNKPLRKMISENQLGSSNKVLLRQ